MFTGIIEEIGRIVHLRRRGRFQRFEVEAGRICSDLEIGDSVNIDGVCQTVVGLSGATFAVESIAETLDRTTLGDLRPGDPVNLERALRPVDRLGGHLVLGHVDGVGRITALRPGEAHWILEVEPPSGLERYIAAKGSIAVDGISLTVVEAGKPCFTAAVIPHTFECTTLSTRSVGARVNLEVDVIARYVERLLHTGVSPRNGLTLEQLREMGY